MITERQFDSAIGDWHSPTRVMRMGVYRNNVSMALINALRVRYPVVAEVAGAALFSRIAYAYADSHRPASPVLIDYGASFPAFVAGFEPAGAIAYLADLAGLESAWWQAYHAAEADVLAPSSLAGVPAEAWESLGFTFHPSLRLVRSSFAVGSIWQERRGGIALGDTTLDLPQAIAVARPQAEVELRIVTPAFGDLLALLMVPLPLARAVQAMMDAHPDFDLTGQFSGLVNLNVITGLAPCSG